MRPIAAIFACAMLMAVSACSPESQASENDNGIAIGSGFDFYVLALSWSPGYCASEGSNADQTQCAARRPYQFIVHGLWPQFKRGYPADCASSYGDKVDNSVIASIIDIMPSAGLIRHEWRKHGTCSGLSQEQYFGVVRTAYDHVKTPPSFIGLRETKTVSPQAVEKLFQAENSALTSGAIATTCSRNYLRDVRICMSKDLESFVNCPEVDANQCNSRAMAVAPIK